VSGPKKSDFGNTNWRLKRRGNGFCDFFRTRDDTWKDQGRRKPSKTRDVHVICRDSDQPNRNSAVAAAATTTTITIIIIIIIIIMGMNDRKVEVPPWHDPFSYYIISHSAHFGPVQQIT
jgi:hypothetical protein